MPNQIFYFNLPGPGRAEIYKCRIIYTVRTLRP